MQYLHIQHFIMVQMPEQINNAGTTSEHCNNYLRETAENRERNRLKPFSFFYIEHSSEIFAHSVWRERCHRRTCERCFKCTPPTDLLHRRNAELPFFCFDSPVGEHQ